MMDAGYKTVGLFELAKNLSINPETAFSDTDHAMYNIDKYVEEKVKDAGREDFSYLQVQYHARGEGNHAVRKEHNRDQCKGYLRKSFGRRSYQTV